MKENLVLLHGALGSAVQLLPLKNCLKDYFKIVTFNFAGHGGRTTDKKYSIDQFTQNTLQALEDHQMKNAHIFGYSMGGYVGLNLALHHPDKVNTIITLGTKFNWTREAAAKEIQRLNPKKMQEKVPAFVAGLQKIHHPISWESVVENTAKMMNDLGTGNALKPKDLQKIKHPTLIAVGSEDNMVSIEESKNAAQTLSNGHNIVLNNVQHPIEKAAPDILAKTIIAHIYK